MNYRELNDYELVSLAQEHNEDAANLLLLKYKPLIEKKCKKIYPSVSKKGLEFSDLVQECIIGFEEAINNFRDSDDVSFYTFCNICMDRQLRSEIVKLNRDKYKILNEAISIDVLTDGGNELSLVDIFAIDKNDPLNDILYNENYKFLMDKIKNNLTKFEVDVFKLKLKGYSNKEISYMLDKDLKAIDNALTRIKIKIKKIVDKYNT